MLKSGMVWIILFKNPVFEYEIGLFYLSVWEKFKVTSLFIECVTPTLSPTSRLDVMSHAVDCVSGQLPLNARVVYI